MSTERKYDDEFKRQAVKLAKELGTRAAVAELCIPKSTLLAWVRNANNDWNRSIYWNKLLCSGTNT